MPADPASNPSTSTLDAPRSQPNHPAAEAFIPLHPRELMDKLQALHPSMERGDDASHLERLQQLYEPLSESIHLAFRRKHLDLLYRYSQFDPDRDAASDEASTGNHVGDVLDAIESLLLAANYHRLTPSQIEETLQTASAWGLRLRIRFRDFRKLRVYARGDTSIERVRRDWWRLYRPRSVEVPIYRKLVVMYEPTPKHLTPKRTRAPRTSNVPPAEQTVLHLKMFKNIPHFDVDMLLPGVVRMSLLEQSKIGIPTLWGFALLVSKLVRNIWLVALLGAMKVLTSLTFIAAFVIAGVWYAIKVFFSYRHARNRHLLNVTQSLYYQTLSNNSGVLLRLLDDAEQQKLSESLTLLMVLLRQANASPQTIQQLDAHCEALLTELGVGPVDFDIDETARFLAGQGLAIPGPSGWHIRSDPSPLS
jgi:hypothetical protein